VLLLVLHFNESDFQYEMRIRLSRCHIGMTK